MALQDMTAEQLRQPATAALKDGSRVVLRPIRPDDAPRLQAFHQRLSPESVYLRWLSAHPVLTDAEAHALTNLDYATRMAYVAAPAEAGDERLLGVARYGVIAGSQPAEAEAAVVVQDDYQGRRLGTLLLTRLLLYARTQGIGAWVAEINAENTRMMRFIQRSGLRVDKRLEGGAWQVRVDITDLGGAQKHG